NACNLHLDASFSVIGLITLPVWHIDAVRGTGGVHSIDLCGLTRQVLTSDEAMADGDVFERAAKTAHDVSLDRHIEDHRRFRRALFRVRTGRVFA
ncbi:MAG: hypothetical protein LBU43_04375, partial [Candidatus Accumulibacter sp.]|nr:hypothetical protein [Accumulibacter sp.]